MSYRKTLLIALISFPLFIFGQTETTDSLNTEQPIKESIFDVFSKQEILEASLTTNLSKMKDLKYSEEYWDGIFSYKTVDGNYAAQDVKIKLRGRFRLKTCDFPPLKLKFKKENLKKLGVNDRYNKMKLITHCLDKKSVSMDLISREFLAYKLYNIIDENGFRVQFVKMKYYDEGKKKPKEKGFGILVEDIEQVADRIGGKKVKEMLVGKQPLNMDQENITALFQYMIANIDWDSKRFYQNIALIELEDKHEYYPLPYDFDFSGFVSAPYARYKKSYGQTSIRDRVFLGRAKTVEELIPAINLFLEKKEELLKEIDNFELLSNHSMTDLRGFIEEFYNIIEDRKNLEATLFGK